MSRYEILRQEILDNANAGDNRQDIQALPYLSAVIKETLRISMANPTRLPHVVPEGGWTFKSTRFPAGTYVGCSAYELHFNEQVFPNPLSFQPERWLEENINPDAMKSFFAFGAGARACIARNLATFELYMATERLVERDVLRGAKACQDKVEIYEVTNLLLCSSSFILLSLGSRPTFHLSCLLLFTEDIVLICCSGSTRVSRVKRLSLSGLSLVCRLIEIHILRGECIMIYDYFEYPSEVELQSMVSRFSSC